MNNGLVININVSIKDYDRPLVSWTHCIISFERSLRMEKFDILTSPHIIRLQTLWPRHYQVTSLNVFAPTSPSFHSKTYKLYLIPMQPQASSKRIWWKLSSATHGIGWCSLLIPLSIVAPLDHNSCSHHTILSSTSQQLSKIPVLQNATQLTTKTFVRASYL